MKNFQIQKNKIQNAYEAYCLIRENQEEPSDYLELLERALPPAKYKEVEELIAQDILNTEMDFFSAGFIAATMVGGQSK